MNYLIVFTSLIFALFMFSLPVNAAMDSMRQNVSNGKNVSEKRFPSAKERVEQNRKKSITATMKKQPMKNMNNSGMNPKAMKKSMNMKKPMSMNKSMGMKKSMKKTMKKSKDSMKANRMK